MLGWVYRNLSEEQPSVGSALQKAENPRCRQRWFLFVSTLQCRLN